MLFQGCAGNYQSSYGSVSSRHYDTCAFIADTAVFDVPKDSYNNKMTLPVGLTSFVGLHSTDYTGLIAAIVITVIPSILVYIFLHDKIIAGMTAGAVKG